ncbi:MAG: 3-hydroxyacyl-CoA dehydrogenase family protein [Oscillospiraceae bacterium]
MDAKKIVCYGSGLIGSSWATNFLMAGLDVTLFDIDDARLEAAKTLINQNFAFLVEQDILKQADCATMLTRLNCTTDAATAVKGAYLIQENGPENIALKQTIAATIEANCPADAIIASSTSGLLISDIAAKATHPERFIGAHPYNPVHLIPLVEMTKGEHTDPNVLQEAYDFYKSIKKEPIILRKEAPGFISNRLQVALFREAADLVDRGVCTIDEVDRAVCYGPGLRLGIIGGHTIFNLAAGPYGIKGALKHLGPAIPVWLADMASWTEWPALYQDLDKIQAMTDEALALRSPEQGRTISEVADFRDKGLVTLLKFHGKL